MDLVTCAPGNRLSIDARVLHNFGRVARSGPAKCQPPQDGERGFLENRFRANWFCLKETSSPKAWQRTPRIACISIPLVTRPTCKYHEDHEFRPLYPQDYSQCKMKQDVHCGTEEPEHAKISTLFTFLLTSEL